MSRLSKLRYRVSLQDAGAPGSRTLTAVFTGLRRCPTGFGSRYSNRLQNCECKSYLVMSLTSVKLTLHVRPTVQLKLVKSGVLINKRPCSLPNKGIFVSIVHLRGVVIECLTCSLKDRWLSIDCTLLRGMGDRSAGDPRSAI